MHIKDRLIGDMAAAFRALFETKSVAAKIWNFANVQCKESLVLQLAIRDLIDELRNDSEIVYGLPKSTALVVVTYADATNTGYSPVHQLIHECYRQSSKLISFLSDEMRVGVKSHVMPLRMVNERALSGYRYEEYTAADALCDLQKLKARLELVTVPLAQYQQTRQPTNADAGIIQTKLLRCKGAVADFNTYIENNFLPQKTGTWTSAVPIGTVPHKAQLLQMRACLDAC